MTPSPVAVVPLVVSKGVHGLRRRWLRAAVIVAFLAISADGAPAATLAFLHATLLRSTPAANSHLSEPPETIHLVFSERVVPDLSQITVHRPDGISVQLQVSNDPHDVHSLVGHLVGQLPKDQRFAEFPSGQYKITWRALSSDGHPVAGSFTFSLEPVAGTIGPGTVSIVAKPLRDSVALDTTAGLSQMAGAEEKPVPLLASLFRGLGLGSLMTGIGLLFFGLTAGERRTLIPSTFVGRLVGVGALLLVAHATAWLDHVSPTGRLSEDFVASMFGSTIGRVELLRVVLALLAWWAIAIARRPIFGLAFGVACLLVSGTIGHPAAIHPAWAIPAKMMHLLAASIWLGGLLWLVWLARCDDSVCRIEAKRVSSIALISVLGILLSGVVQTRLFLNAPGDLIYDTYGRLVLAKALGLTVLVGFGAYNRLRLMPKLEALDGAEKLARSVRQEIAIVTIVILIGGFLAYVPTPPIPQTVVSAPTAIPQ